MSIRPLVRAIALLLAGRTLGAQATPGRDTAAHLPPVTVTASRGATSILTTPLAITTIAAPALRAVNGYGLEQALALVPGVVAQSRYGTSDVRLMIRGFGARGAGDRSNSGTARGVRVLLDGFPETEPDGRTAFDHIDLATTEAVEVVRSNASALWGNAAGGVINLVSVPSDAAPTLEVQSILGGFGLRRYAVRASTPLGAGGGRGGGGGTAFASFTNSTFDGWRAHSDARRVVLNAGAVGSVGERTRLGVFLVAANNLMHTPGPLTQAQVDADATQAHVQYASRDERRYNRLGRLGVSVEHALDSTLSLSSMLYVNPKYLQRSERNTYRDFTRVHVGGNVVARKDLLVGGLRTRLALGVDEAYQDGSIQFYNLADGRRGTTLVDNKGEGASNVGVFLHDELQVGDRLGLVLGARYDDVTYYYRSFLATAPVRSDSRSFERVSPKLGATWRLGATTSLYGNVGGGIEVPAGNETDPAPGPTPAPPALLNPLLDPISSTSYELGLKAIALRPGGARVTLSYDVALYDTEVRNEIIPYNGGRYYATAARARRSGIEIGGTAESDHGLFASTALTVARNRYVDYVIDSAVIDPARAGRRSDRSGNAVVGLPGVVANAEIGAVVPGVRGARLKLGVEHSGRYVADDANTVRVPAFTIFNLTAELRRPIVAAGGWGVRGFVTVHNLTGRSYIGSAFLNPDPVPGGTAPAAYEPGMPRSLIVSLSAGRLR